MSMIELLAQAKNQGIRLWIEDDVLRFKAPEGRMDENLKKEIGKRKGEIIAFLKSSVAGSSDPIPLADRREPLPLSQGQRWLWTASSMEGGASTFNIPAAFRLRGPLDRRALERSLNAIIARHEILRTNYRLEDGQLRQRVAPQSVLRLAVDDLETLPGTEASEAVRRAFREQMETPFDLESDLLVRARLLRLSAAEHALVLGFHHIVCDNHSMSVFMEELGALYETFENSPEERPADLPPPALQYADYAAWQKRWLEGEGKQAQLDFWRTALAGLDEAPEIQGDLNPSEPVSHRSVRRNFLLDEVTLAALKTAGRQHGASFYVTLLSIVYLLLFQYSAKRDLAVGTPVAARARPELERLMGLFFNTVVIRTRIEEHWSFSEFLEKVRRSAAEAFACQEIPFEVLLEELKPRRRARGNPYFQVLFNMYAASYEGRAGTLKLEPFDRDSVGGQNLNSKFDITILAIEHEKGLQLDLSFRADLYTPSSADWLVGQFQVLLQSVARAPSSRIGDLPALRALDPRPLRPPAPSADDRGLPRFRAFEDSEVEQSIVSRFEKIAAEYADRPALESEEESLDYAGLKARADVFAVAVGAALEGRKGERVALLLRKGTSLVAALLGVLKSGATVVPLDPDYPPERLKLFVEDSGAALIVCDAGTADFAGRLTQGTAVRVLRSEELSPDGTAAGFGEVRDHSTVESLAYIVYTSGSTGQPKGVTQTHRNALHYTMNYTNGLEIGAGDVLSLIPSFAFSAALMDVFAALCNGALLCLYDLKKRGVSGLGSWLLQKNITVYHSVPTVFRSFVESLPPEARFPRLRIVDLGGEPVTRRDVELHRRHFPDDGLLVNGLGATELNVIRQFTLDRNTAFDGDLVPVGYEVAGTKILILDADGSPVGWNQAGEIVIESPFLSPGYWNQPQQTAAAFSVSAAGIPLYRTGDLGRFRPDGCLEHLGRKDLQLKIRGIRIEPVEIEGQLLSFTGVKEAVVVARDREDGAKELCAFLVASDGRPVPEAGAVREYLLDKLPEFMIPPRITVVPSLPLTPTGKVDRRALSNANLEGKTTAIGITAPRTEVEKTLAELWMEALKVPAIGIHDSFFQAGGDSLIAAQFVSRAKALFGVEVPFRVLFRMQTIAEIAIYIENARKEAAAGMALTPGAGLRETGEIE